MEGCHRLEGTGAGKVFSEDPQFGGGGRAEPWGTEQAHGDGEVLLPQQVLANPAGGHVNKPRTSLVHPMPPPGVYHCGHGPAGKTPGPSSVL